MRIIKAGATSQSVYVCILDSASTTGGRKTGIVYNSAGLTAYYTLNGGSATAITLATLAAANSSYSSGGFKEVDATNQPGIYRLDLPNAALASGPSVVVSLKGASGMVQVDLDIQLVAVDLQDATSFGLSRLDAAVTSRMATYTQPTGFLAATFPATVASTTNITSAAGIAVSSIGNNVITAASINAAALNGKGDWNTTTPPTVGAIATAVWQDTTAGDFTVASSIGKSLYTTGNAPGAASGLALVGSNMGTATSVTGSVGSVTGAVGSVTGAVGSVTGNVGGNVVGSVASVTGNVGGNVVGSVASVTAGVTVTTNNDKTGYALTSAEENAIADALLGRNVSGGSSAGRTVKQALHVLRNKTSISGGTLTVYDTDDTTSSFTATVTTTAGDPISQIDPA